jgi:hypothetical protein
LLDLCQILVLQVSLSLQVFKLFELVVEVTQLRLQVVCESTAVLAAEIEFEVFQADDDMLKIYVDRLLFWPLGLAEWEELTSCFFCDISLVIVSLACPSADVYCLRLDLDELICAENLNLLAFVGLNDYCRFYY